MTASNRTGISKDAQCIIPLYEPPKQTSRSKIVERVLNNITATSGRVQGVFIGEPEIRRQVVSDETGEKKERPKLVGERMEDPRWSNQLDSMISRQSLSSSQKNLFSSNNHAVSVKKAPIKATRKPSQAPVEKEQPTALQSTGRSDKLRRIIASSSKKDDLSQSCHAKMETLGTPSKFRLRPNQRDSKCLDASESSQESDNMKIAPIIGSTKSPTRRSIRTERKKAEVKTARASSGQMRDSEKTRTAIHTSSSPTRQQPVSTVPTRASTRRSKPNCESSTGRRRTHSVPRKLVCSESTLKVCSPTCQNFDKPVAARLMDYMLFDFSDPQFAPISVKQSIQCNHFQDKPGKVTTAKDSVRLSDPLDGTKNRRQDAR